MKALLKISSMMAFVMVLFVGWGTSAPSVAEAAGYKGRKPSSSSYRPSYSRSRYSAPSYRQRSGYAPRKRYTSPPRHVTNHTTVINRNYNRGGMGGMGGGGLGTSILGGAAGAVGGMMLYDVLKGPSSGDRAVQQQQEQQRIDAAVQDQKDRDQMDRIEQKLDAQQRQPDPYFQLNPGNTNY